LDANDKAPILSHPRVGGIENGNPRYLNKIQSRNNFATVNATNLYSASLLDLDTISYFLTLQLMRQGPRKIAYPVVDLLSSRFSSQLESLKVLRLRDPLPKNNP
jgi:hypothetical protein